MAFQSSAMLNPTHLDAATQSHSGAVSVKIYPGWNVVPLPLLYQISGRYWSTFRAGKTTCDFDVPRDVWMWSPVAGKYMHFGMDDWGAAAQRNNQELVGEFNSKSFSVFYGSGWIYSSKSCVLSYDDVAGTPQMASQSSSNDLEPSRSYSNYNADLTLKKGWNFVPIDYWMSTKEYGYVFGDCQISAINSWNPEVQGWEAASGSAMANAARQLKATTPFSTDDSLFRTYLMKVDADCKISMLGSSAGGPPAIPQ